MYFITWGIQECLGYLFSLLCLVVFGMKAESFFSFFDVSSVRSDECKWHCRNQFINRFPEFADGLGRGLEIDVLTCQGYQYEQLQGSSSGNFCIPIVLFEPGCKISDFIFY